MRGGRVPYRRAVWSAGRTLESSHSPAGVNESDQQRHGHSEGSVLAIFLPKHAQFLLCETNKTLACEHSSVSFQHSLTSTILLWPRGNSWDQSPKLLVLNYAGQEGV